MIASVKQCVIVICTCCLLLARAAPTNVETHNIKKRFFGNPNGVDFDSVLDSILQIHNQNKGPNNNFGQTITGPRWQRDVDPSESSIRRGRSNAANTETKKTLAALLQKFRLTRDSSSGRKTRSSLYYELLSKAEEHMDMYGEYPSLGGLDQDSKNGPSWLGGYGKK